MMAEIGQGNDQFWGLSGQLYLKNGAVVDV